jgi:hypothetical protein
VVLGGQPFAVTGDTLFTTVPLGGWVDSVQVKNDTLKTRHKSEGSGGLPGNAQAVPRICPGKNARALLPGHFFPYWSRSGVEERESRGERLVISCLTRTQEKKRV